MKRRFVSYLPGVLILAQVILPATVKCQWIQLPQPQSGITTTSAGPWCNVTTVPVQIIPCGDGRIVYTSLCYFSPSSGASGRLCYSTDDLATMTVKKSTPSGFGNGGFKDLRAYSNSVFTWSEVTNTYYNGFISTDGLQSSTSLGGPGGSAGIATDLTPTFYYSILPFYQDSLSLKRFHRTTSAISIFKTKGYIPLDGKLDFLNDSIGFMVVTVSSNTVTTVLLRTGDFGKTWQEKLSSVSDPIADFKAFADGRVYVLTRDGKVSWSANSGNTWQTVPDLSGSDFKALLVYDAITWFAGGASGQLIKTTSAGANWVTETTNTTDDIVSIYSFLDQGYFVTSTNGVYKSAQPVGLLKHSSAAKSFAWPNPSTGNLTVSISSVHWASARSVEVSLLDISGREVYREIVNSPTATIYLPDAASGMYHVRICSGQAVEVLKVVIEK
jgi:hypothetical protein